MLAEPGTVQQVYGGLDSTVLLFTFGVSIGAAILFGLMPALQASRVAIDPVLKSVSKRNTGSGARLWLNRAFVLTQAALSMMLVIGAALFATNLFGLYRINPGYEPDQIVSAAINARNSGITEAADYAALAQRLVDRISEVPGVRSATVSAAGFLNPTNRTSGARIEGRAEAFSIRVDQSSRSLLKTLGIPIVAGREFQEADRAGAPEVVIVNQQFARIHFEGENPLGKRMTFSNGKAAEIVGVAADAKFNDIREQPVALAFLPIDQFPARFNFINVRTAGRAPAVLPFITRAILDVEPRLRPTRVETLEASLDRVISRDILLARLSGLFGTLALLVACFGIYGMISYVVASRTREIGIRLALGAQTGEVRRSVIVDALKTVIPGLALGVVGALATEEYIESLLFGVTGKDPWTYASVAAGLTLTSILAAWLPARRASRIDPVIALRCD
jgi:predicted permease